jgi:hypothetical protein
MINRIVSGLGFIFFVLVSFQSGAQETIILDGFSGIAQAREVHLHWVISAGQSCNGTNIERSTDTLNWEEIGDIPGICGNSSDPVPYNFTDDSPVSNTVNYYRLELGGQGYSPVIGVPYYNFVGQGHVLIPNPAHEMVTLYFSASVEEKFTVSFFDIKGQLVWQDTGNGGKKELDVSQLQEGNYIFVISRKGKKNVSGKIMIR